MITTHAPSDWPTMLEEMVASITVVEICKVYMRDAGMVGYQAEVPRQDLSGEPCLNVGLAVASLYAKWKTSFNK